MADPGGPDRRSETERSSTWCASPVLRKSAPKVSHPEDDALDRFAAYGAGAQHLRQGARKFGDELVRAAALAWDDDS